MLQLMKILMKTGTHEEMTVTANRDIIKNLILAFTIDLCISSGGETLLSSLILSQEANFTIIGKANTHDSPLSSPL